MEKPALLRLLTSAFGTRPLYRDVRDQGEYWRISGPPVNAGGPVLLTLHPPISDPASGLDTCDLWSPRPASWQSRLYYANCSRTRHAASRALYFAETGPDHARAPPACPSRP